MEISRMNVLVTGATGAIGPCIVSSLVETGYAVRTLSLDPPPINNWPAGLDARLGDVSDAAAVQHAMKDVDVVIHLAALLHIVNPQPELYDKYKKVNIGGSETVVEAAIKEGVNRFVLASTIAVYGPSEGRILFEGAGCSPDTLYGQSKLAAEKIVLKAKSREGQPLGTVLRFGAIYGAHIKGNYQRLVHALSRGRFIPVGDGTNRRTLIYEKDVARAVVLAMQHPAAAGKVYNVTDGQIHTVKEIILTICTALGHAPPRLSMPVIPVRLAVGALEDISGLIGFRPPIARVTIDKYMEDIAVDSQRIQTELGFTPEYNIQAGWQETIQELRHCGKI